MSFSRNFEELFLKSEIESERIDDLWGSGEKTKIEEFLKSINELYMEEFGIYSAINEFTKSTVSKERKEQLITELLDYDIVNSVEILKDMIVMIKTKKGFITAGILSKLIPELQEDKDIETTGRNGKCHTKSVELSAIIPEENEVVTGFIYGMSNKSKYLHSWIETKYDNKEFVIDYTLNAFMNKEGYYLIKHAQPISRIGREDIINDKKILNQFETFKIADIKEYLIFRDEIMKDFQKNVDKFDLEER